ncbi:MAG: DNRLRE domain-containing protein [Clostridiales bacterium]|nr:DNRLRE domain-containing protein [Clostridiales bacterium]
MEKNKENKILSATLAAAMIGSTVSAVPALADENTIPALADASVSFSAENAQVNYGTQNYLIADSSDAAAGSSVVYLKFDISKVNAADAGDISLRLKVLEGNAEVELNEAENEWDEESISGLNAPVSTEGAVGSAAVENGELVISGLKDVVANAAAKGKTEISFVLYVNENALMSFASKESGSAPVLEISAPAENAEEAAVGELPFAPISVDEAAILFAVEDDTKVDEVIADILALQSAAENMNVENYTQNWLQIKAVREKYNALSYYEKASVGNEKLQILTSIETKYASLLDKDFKNLGDMVSIIPELTAANYLEEVRKYDNAEAAYSAYEQRQQATKDTDYTAKYDEAMNAVSTLRSKLDSFKEQISALMNATKDKFINGGNGVVGVKDIEWSSISSFETVEPRAGQTYISPQMKILYICVSSEDYKNFLDMEKAIKGGNDGITHEGSLLAQYLSIKNSELFSQFTEDTDMKEALKTFVTGYYKYMSNQLKVIYGSEVQGDLADHILNEDQWEHKDEKVTNAICTYLASQNREAESERGTLKQLAGEDYMSLIEDYSSYNSRLFESMTNIIADEVKELENAIYALLKSEGADGNSYGDEKFSYNSVPTANWLDEITLNDIDRVYAAAKKNMGFSPSIQLYLHEACYGDEQVDDHTYPGLFDDINWSKGENTPATGGENSAITAAKKELKKAAKTELDRYSDIVTSIEDYSLNYMSGYDGHEDPDTFIAGCIEELNNIDAAALLDYARKMKPYGAVQNDEYGVITESLINNEKAAAEAAISAFEEKLADIKSLRAKAKNLRDAFNAKYFSWDYMEQFKGYYDEQHPENSVPYYNYSKHEDVCAFIDEMVIAPYNESHPDAPIEIADVMGAIDDMILADAEYKTELAGYRNKYLDEFVYLDTEAFEALYLTEDEEIATSKEINDISGRTKKHIDMSGFMNEVSDLNNTAMGFAAQKESLYTAQNGFSAVVGAMEDYAELSAQYNAFSADQLYCVTRETNTKLGTIKSELEAWQKAIDVMDKIDAVEGTTDIDEFTRRINEARAAYEALNGQRAKELVAQAALDKLDRYQVFGDLYVEIAAIDPIVSQYQIVLFEGSGDEPGMLDQLRARFDALGDGYEDISDFVSRAQRILEDREFELACAKDAQRIDGLIKNLDAFDLEDESALMDYLNAFVEVEREVNALLEPSQPNERPANMTFGMLLQYSKYTHHREDIDGIWSAAFAYAIDQVGTIEYTSNFGSKAELIAVADGVYRDMNDRQKSAAQDDLARLEQIKADLARCRQAKEDAQETIAILAEFAAEVERIESIEYKPAREAEYQGMIHLISDNDDMLTAMKEAQGAERYAYDYMYENGYIDTYRAQESRYMDNYQYYAVQCRIDMLWSEAQEAHRNGTLLDSIALKECEDLYKALANFESPYADGRTQQELVENYSKLAWVRIQASEDYDLYINQLADYMNTAQAGYEKSLMELDADALAISYKPVISHAINLYDAMSSEVQATMTESYRTQIEALRSGLDELLRLYEIRGGKAGDVDEDGKVTIKDIVMIVDFVLDNDIAPENNAQYLRADIVHPDDDMADSPIDIDDVIAAIDLIEF